MYTPKYSVILSNLGPCCDRYLSSGYSRSFTIEEMFERAAGIENMEGIELISNAHISGKNVNQIRQSLEKTGLKLVSIIPDHSGHSKWGKGAFTSKDPQIRTEAISHTKEMMDIAGELGCNLLSIWPGQDGYDYYFQTDYIQERIWLEEGLKECCTYKKDINISIEYKIKEPRNRSFASTVSNTLLIIGEVGESNCGVTLDFGHAIVAYENAAESVAILKKYGDKLFHVHMNDNYGYWDDDMIAGSVHTISYLEFLFWLKKTEYKGWLSMDQYPYREDGKQAVSESINWLKALNNTVDRMDMDEVERLLKIGNAPEASRFLRKYILQADS